MLFIRPLCPHRDDQKRLRSVGFPQAPHVSQQNHAGIVMPSNGIGLIPTESAESVLY